MFALVVQRMTSNGVACGTSATATFAFVARQSVSGGRAYSVCYAT